MLFRVLIIGVFILELFGCSSTSEIKNAGVSDKCYESTYMANNDDCLNFEIKELENDLNDIERSIYEMAKRKINDKYHKIYFLRLSPRERRDYLAYLYNGEPPVYVKNSFFQ